KGLLEGTLQAGTSAVSDKLLDLVGLGGKSAADKGKDTRDYLAAAFPELNAWERAGADASSAGMVDAGMKMLTMTNLSTECLIQLTKLGYDATPFNQILKQNAKREMRLRLGKVTVADVLAAQP